MFASFSRAALGRSKGKVKNVTNVSMSSDLPEPYWPLPHPKNDISVKELKEWTVNGISTGKKRPAYPKITHNPIILKVSINSRIPKCDGGPP